MPSRQSGDEDVHPYPYLSSALDGAGVQRHVPAALPRERDPVLIK
jgi:hypothetical protein